MAEICGFGLRFRNGGARKSGKTVLLAAGDAGRLSRFFRSVYALSRRSRRLLRCQEKQTELFDAAFP